MALFYARCAEICPFGSMDVAAKEKLQIDMLVSFIKRSGLEWKENNYESTKI